ncbi:hypothetical protein [Streptomyces liliifuscus]|uniref:Secreted protein n=1 Tax=Streptomyces liliifuscus TaxID=2797636 RepID=A0A7T7HZU2_9ACTN|nr:hypothetical protein [Streptomyces liliifuscus]QQM38318.1 hypothetical protein JEQ17_01690 [Streptomyces liliifuscus]
MRLRTRTVAAAFLVAAALSALGQPALAAPMPWDSHRSPSSSQASAPGHWGQTEYHDNGQHDNGFHDSGYHDS